MGFMKCHVFGLRDPSLLFFILERLLCPYFFEEKLYYCLKNRALGLPGCPSFHVWDNSLMATRNSDEFTHHLGKDGALKPFVNNGSFNYQPPSNWWFFPQGFQVCHQQSFWTLFWIEIIISFSHLWTNKSLLY